MQMEDNKNFNVGVIGEIVYNGKFSDIENNKENFFNLSSDLKVCGGYDVEFWGGGIGNVFWTDGDFAGVLYPKGGEKFLYVEFGTGYGNGLYQVNIRLLYSGKVFFDIVLIEKTNIWVRKKLLLKTPCVSGIMGVLIYSDTFIPILTGVNMDMRKLGVAIKKFGLM